MDMSLNCVLKLKTLDQKYFQNTFDTDTKNLFQENYLLISLKVIYILQTAEIKGKEMLVLKRPCDPDH